MSYTQMPLGHNLWGIASEISKERVANIYANVIVTVVIKFYCFLSRKICLFAHLIYRRIAWSFCQHYDL